MKYIAVFCSAQDIDEKYSAPAVEFSRLLAADGYGLVWGGTDVGLMRSIAEAVREGGGRLIGVSMEILKHLIEMMSMRKLSPRIYPRENRSCLSGVTG